MEKPAESERKGARKGLILAAGRGRRLAPDGCCKPLEPVLGRPLIEWAIGSARLAGVQEFYVVVGYRSRQVRRFLEALARKEKIVIRVVENERWREENGISVLKARSLLQEEFVLLMADHLVDCRIIARIRNKRLHNEDVIVAVDMQLNNPMVDIDDATKVHIEDEKVRAINKKLSVFNGFDTGVFLCSPGIFDALWRSAEMHGDTTLSGGIRYLASRGRAGAMDIGHRFWIDVDDGEMVKKAELFLLSSLSCPPRPALYR